MTTEVLEEIESINTADQFTQCRERLEKALVARMMVWWCVYMFVLYLLHPMHIILMFQGTSGDAPLRARLLAMQKRLVASAAGVVDEASPVS